MYVWTLAKDSSQSFILVVQKMIDSPTTLRLERIKCGGEKERGTLIGFYILAIAYQERGTRLWTMTQE